MHSTNQSAYWQWCIGVWGTCINLQSLGNANVIAEEAKYTPYSVYEAPSTRHLHGIEGRRESADFGKSHLTLPHLWRTLTLMIDAGLIHVVISDCNMT
jgi:hypothetical protein